MVQPSAISSALATFSREHSARAARGNTAATTKTPKTIVATLILDIGSLEDRIWISL
jgi:hypothetical protein